MKSRRDRAISISALLLSVTIFFVGPVYGDLDCVRWEDLAQHLSEKSIPLIQRKLCDSPANIQDAEPDRVVSQVIENTFYLWEEYDLATDTDVSMCVVMKKPNPGPLSAQEARVLLTGSMLWEELEPEPLEPPDEEEVVLGIDDRIRITETEGFPWNTHCALDSITYGDSWVAFGRGTGCLVSPYMVLTCAHTIYSHDRGLYIDEMTVTPGQTQNMGGSTITPYGVHNVVRFQIAPEFTSQNRVRYEYGAVFLEKPVAGINTYMPLEFSSSLSKGDTVGIAGYPGTVQNEANSRALWDASGSISDIYLDALCYTTDTSAGQSGAPIRHKNSLHEPYRIIGIHSNAATADFDNYGARLGAHNQELISEWMQWTPGAIFEDTFPSRTINTDNWAVVNGATVDNTGISEPSSPYSLRLNIGDSATSTAVDLLSYPQVTLTYSYQHRGDFSWLDIEYHNGFEWMPLDNQSGTWLDMAVFEESKPIRLPAAALHASFRLRIKSGGFLEDENGSGDAANWFVDDVKLMPGPNGPTGMVFVAIDDPGIYQPYIGEMSKYETTNAQYCQFLNAALADGLIVVHKDYYHRRVYAASDTDYDQPYCEIVNLECPEEDMDPDFGPPDNDKPYVCSDFGYSQIDYRNDTFSVLSRDGLSMANHPVVAVSWYGATAFCDYYGYRLPSRLELRAVADYHGTYTYACGASIDSTKANYGNQNPLGLTDSYTYFYSPDASNEVYSPVYTSPVGYYPAYGYGLCDLDGNVSEWTSTDALLSDPVRYYRWGGDWGSSPLENNSIDNYNDFYADGMSRYIGFRVCR